MNWAAIVWLVLIVVFLMVEASTVTLVSLWFAAGALAALIAALFGAELFEIVFEFHILCLLAKL